ncbi:nanos homolog 3 [Syngnathoides biaculeatus]|uniref:nanos homolog 3 n=1 Tax=Syngnathoides biaculeatus TaxID=300417 RepID=UPI002ADDA415|nr:nanos homolog 3 [Syngnathoides biaculeatus]
MGSKLIRMGCMGWGLCDYSSRLMESNSRSFQPWKDYMGLSGVVQGIIARNNSEHFTPAAYKIDEAAACGGLRQNALPERSEPETADVPAVAVGSSSLRFNTRQPGGGQRDDALLSANRPTEAGMKGAPSGPERSETTARQESPRSPSPVRMRCMFCKNNGETESVYKSHRLKNQAGEVLCPYLSRYVCPLCGATGTKAHTKRFCPNVDKEYISIYTNPKRRRATWCGFSQKQDAKLLN